MNDKNSDSNDKKSNSKFESVQAHIRWLTRYALKIAIIILLAVVAWRIAWASFSLDLSNFDFSDLLAMILALFAVAMSVAFYFKTTDTSNQFYDNTYNFTQKISEILGRIEERFGERLKHLDEGYGRIQSRFDDFSKSPKEIEEKVKETEEKVKETEGKQEEEKEKLKTANEALQQMLDRLFQKAELQEKEKEEFYEQLAKLEKEKDSAQARIREIEEDRDRMQSQLHLMEREISDGLDGTSHNLIAQLLRHPGMRNLIIHEADPDVLRGNFRQMLPEFGENFGTQLRRAGIVNDRRELTSAGISALRTFSQHHFQ